MKIENGRFVELQNGKILKVYYNHSGELCLKGPLQYNGSVEAYQAGCWGGPIVRVLPEGTEPPSYKLSSDLSNIREYLEFYNRPDLIKQLT